MDIGWSQQIPDPQKIGTGNKWQSKVSTWLITSAHAIWLQQNAERYPTDPDTELNAERNETEAKLTKDRHLSPLSSTGNTPTSIPMRSPHTLISRTTYSISNVPPPNKHTRGPNKPAVVRNPVLGTRIHRHDNSTTDILLHCRRISVLPTPADHRMGTSYIRPDGHIMEPTNTGPATTRQGPKMADIRLSLPPDGNKLHTA